MVLQPNLMFVTTFYEYALFLFTFTLLILFFFLPCALFGGYMGSLFTYICVVWLSTVRILYCCGRRYVCYVSRCASSVSWALYVFFTTGWIIVVLCRWVLVCWLDPL